MSDGLMREGSAVVPVLGIVAGRVVAHCFFFKKNILAGWIGYVLSINYLSVLTRTPLTYSYHS